MHRFIDLCSVNNITLLCGSIELNDNLGTILGTYQSMTGVGAQQDTAVNNPAGGLTGENVLSYNSQQP